MARGSPDVTPGSAPMAMHLRVIESLEELQASAAEWSRLLERVGGTVFLTPQWITSWFAALEGVATPAVAVVEDNTGSWRGVLPMARTTQPWGPVQLKVTDFAGAQVTTSDHLALVAAGADADIVWECIRPWIEAEARSAHILRFSGMDDGSMVARLRALRTLPGWRARGPMHEVAPFLELPDTYDAYEQSLSANRRQQLRRFNRRLQQEQQPVRFCTNDATRSLDEVIADMTRLHDALWTSRRLPGTLGRPTMQRFVRRFCHVAHREGWLRLHQLYIGDRMAAAILVLHWGHTACYYQSGWDLAFQDLHVGELILVHSIRHAIEERMRIYDLLRGSESYKGRYATGSVPQVSYEFAARPIGKLRLLASFGRAGVGRLLRRLRPRAPTVRFGPQ
jgi:CelD/BcsL family acetyltransferase involved in cellulose biosynthesis